MRQHLAYLLFTLLLGGCLLFGGCASTRSTAPSAGSAAPLVLISVASTDVADAIIHRANEAGATGVLIEVGDSATSLLKALGVAGFQRVSRLTVEEASESAADGIEPTQKLRRWLQANDVDHLHIEASGSQAARVEAIAAEARLIRDYLTITSNVNEPHLGGATQLSTGNDDTWALHARSEPPAGQVAVGLDLSAFSGTTSAVVVDRPGSLSINASGRIAWLSENLPDTLSLVISSDTLSVPTRDWKRPFDYALTRAGKTLRVAPWVELRRQPRSPTSAAVFEILGRTDSSAAASINGVAAHVYQTGVFFDSIHFGRGANRLEMKSVGPHGVSLFATQIVHEPGQPRSPLPLWIEEGSLTPAEDLELLPADYLLVQFTGAIGHEGIVKVEPGGHQFTMIRSDQEDAGLYSARLPMRLLEAGTSYRLSVVLHSSLDNSRIRRPLAATLLVRGGVDAFPVLRTTSDRCPISFSLGRVRLGGPFLAEYGKGVELQSSGRFGSYHRIRLGPTQVGYIHQRYVESLPQGSIPPGFHIASLHARARPGADIVSIPWSEPVPYSIQADPEGRRLLVTLYGVKTTSTWVQQRADMRYVERLSWEQLDAETYQVAIHLTTPMIWGYDLQPQGRSLILRLPYPRQGHTTEPANTSEAEQPLAGLRIAIEAGHGGTNTGAEGLSGLLEKDVNLDTSRRLGAICEEAGAEVIQLRTQDTGVPYFDRIDSLERSQADLVVSIHANAAGGGFLRASGTSTFYHNPFWEPFARRVYDRMRELDYEEFGVVGSFNYRNIRLSSRPTILVEQAFMSHAVDEERLADPAHRQEIAEKILAGLVDYLADLRASEEALGAIPEVYLETDTKAQAEGS
ncbi:MAG: N-acetylmuramoyl-L-alanine amidase [Gemmatimonadetes bacterium]|nr:N-acetylmuramoyl-L-alanine amidase [Gemmatimonadota bacterium]